MNLQLKTFNKDFNNIYTPKLFNFKMEATIVNYRVGKRTQTVKQMVLQPKAGKTKADAEKLVGKKVEWTTESGKKLSGTVTKPHGRNGAVLAKFEKGLPGQALGTKVEIL